MICSGDIEMSDLLAHLVNEEMVLAALKGVMDPELGLNVVDLGLIYDVDLDEEGRVAVTMTLTTPACPMHAGFSREIERTLTDAFPGLRKVSVQLVWDPPWHPAMISEEGQARLGLVG